MSGMSGVMYFYDYGERLIPQRLPTRMTVRDTGGVLQFNTDNWNDDGDDYIENDHTVDLGVEQAQKLYDELGRWLKTARGRLENGPHWEDDGTLTIPST